jgi:hypothetical protein
MTRSGAGSVYTYSARHRWAYVPTVLFLLVIFAILVVDPSLVWHDLDPSTRRAGILLAAALAIGFAVALLARWASPFRFNVGADALEVAPLIGSSRRVAYADIRDVRILPKTFMRSVPEVVLQVDPGRPVVIRTDITGYQQLERALRRRLAPDLQARWKEARDS